MWDFVRGCMRTYKILKARAQAFDNDPEVRELVAGQENPQLDPLLQGYTREKAARLRDLDVDAEVLAQRGLRYERLDQIMMEHLLGARG